MKQHLYLTKDELIDRLYKNDYDPGCVEKDSWKWGHSEKHVFFINEKYWAVWLNFHPEDGVQLYDNEVELHEVKPVKITITKWETA